MPIVDVRIVAPSEKQPGEGVAKALAQALAEALGAPDGRIWVRLQCLDAHMYAENGASQHPNPVFITILHADLPTREELAAEARAVCAAVAGCLNWPPEWVHVEYSPPGRGRVAFGGKLMQ